MHCQRLHQLSFLEWLIKNMSKIVVVNATALRLGGGLSILNQFIEKIDKRVAKFVIFVHVSYVVSQANSKNATFVKVDKTSMLKRILWDGYGLKKWLDYHSVVPDLVISLQNTSINIKTYCPQVIYLHQAIPFSNIRWSIFKSDDFRFIIYKHFYQYFIFKYFGKKDIFVVQTNWMKEALLKMGSVNNADVFVIQPKFNIENVNDIVKLRFPKSQRTIFYPAAALSYKNHIEIIDALIYLRDYIKDIDGVKVYFTISRKEAAQLNKVICENHLRENFCFTGALSHSEMLSYYKSVDLVVFPSSLESFGLPLIEAAEFGKRIVASDLSYAREVLNGYSGVKFAKMNSPLDWAIAIDEMLLDSNKQHSYIPPKNAGWDVFFEIIKNRLI